MIDVIIIGAGVIGANVARRLSKYKLNVLVLEKENDVGNGASGANSAIVHSGYDPKPGSLKARLNVRGNEMFDDICNELDVKMLRIGSITLALNDEEVKTLASLEKRAEENQVRIEILDHDDLKRIEPNITDKVKKGLLAPTAGIINPFEFVVALMENAIDNGVELHLNEAVTGIRRCDDGFVVTTNKGEYVTKKIVNASGVFADEINELVNPKRFTITPRKGEYYVLDHFDASYINHVLFNVPSSKGKGVLVSPTTHYNYLIGPSSEFVDSKDDTKTTKEILNQVKNNAYNLVDNLALNYQIRQFSGLRAVSDNDDFIIEETSPNFINVAGIQSPGFASSPAIAEMVEELLKIDAENNPTYCGKRRPLYRLNEKTVAERSALIQQDQSFGRVICRCEGITEGEIVDAIHRSCGATTIKGVKKRVRPGFGKCQGGFCEPLVMKILCRELHKTPLEIEYGSSGSYILLEKTKGEDDEL